MGLTIVYCAVDGCDHVLATGPLELAAFVVGHRGDADALHEGGLFLRVASPSIDRHNHASADELLDILAKKLGGEVKVEETQCIAVGDPVCRFVMHRPGG